MATNTEKLNDLVVSVTKLTTAFGGVEKQSAAMYKILVTGNGAKPLPEVVRNHDEWIECEKEKQKVGDTRKWEVRKTYIGLSIGWFLTLVGLCVAIFR